MIEDAQYEYNMNIDEDAWLDSWDDVFPPPGSFGMDVHDNTQPRGRCMVAKKYDLLAVGGYDGKLRYSVDDVDLACKLMDRGLSWHRMKTNHVDHPRHWHKLTALNECKVFLRHHKRHHEFTNYILGYQWGQFHPLKWLIQLAGYSYYGLFGVED